jgi:ABC-2 type transport system ATP-binding protein
MADSPPAIQIEGLVKRINRFGRSITAIDGLDLCVPQGQVLGLAGPNGCGKSMTLRVLLGLARPTAGRALIFGEQCRPGAAVLARVGALVDGPGFVPHLSGLANLRLAWRLTRRPESEACLDAALALAGLDEAIHLPYHTYSHGMRYRLALAQALLGHPDLLLLDEPTTGLDPAQVIEVHHAITELARRGATVLLSSHRLGEVERVCSHVALMRQGRLVTTGRIADLTGPAISAGGGRRSLEEVYLELVHGMTEGSSTSSRGHEDLAS